MLGASLVLAVVVLSSTPSSDPTALVAQLGSSRYALRESAEVELAKLGRIALPAIRAGKDSKDPEIRIRALALLSRIEKSLLVQPTSFTFDFQSQTISEVIKAINQRSGLSLVLEPAGNRVFQERRLTFRTTEPLPFWTALDSLCTAGQLHYIPGAQVPLGQREGTFPLYDGLNPSKEPVSDFGPFRVHLTSVHYQSEIHLSAPGTKPSARSNFPILPDESRRQVAESARQFYLHLCVAAEPRLSITQNGAVKLQTAVDDRGQSLLIRPGSGTFQHLAGYYGLNPTPMVRLRLDLAHPEVSGQRISLIKGTIPVSVATRKPEPLEIPIPGSLGKTFKNDEVSLTLREVRPSKDNQPAVIELSVTSLGPVAQTIDLGDGEPLAYRPDAPQQQIEILDEEGRTLPWFPSGTFYNGEETRLTLTVVTRGGPVTPAKIRYHEIIRASTEIPFEFRDVPMP